jgi:hypothetical protein
MQGIALEMRWQMGDLMHSNGSSSSSSSGSYSCDSCAGVGKKQCRFCGGHCMIRAGSSETYDCPVCKAKGVEPCQVCRGAGRIANWMR